MKYLILTAALILPGCSTLSGTKVIIQEVKVPIAMPCATAEPAVPDYKFFTLTAEADLFTKVKTLLADQQLRIAYELELLTALQSCK